MKEPQIWQSSFGPKEMYGSFYSWLGGLKNLLPEAIATWLEQVES